ncbi:MAG: hypothetical protein HS101_10510 [Planctomycetia bacterium]|jgi:hypothetical protein|nr:hypothetical protein [Planctomycetia bacterium]MCC7316842.1 hypothetical protein [Planctomycetota bacterium]
MTKQLAMTTTVMTMSLLCLGCGRIFSESMGARGASGRVVDSSTSQDLSKYKSLNFETITVAKGVQAPTEMPALIRSDFLAVADERGLGQEGEPGLRLSGEIIHYETGSKLDTVTGPLEQVILRTTLTDVQSGEVVQETNLVGRSKASSSSGAESLAGGLGKALNTWLKNGGVKNSNEKSEG